jgi:hypothetical protein
VIATAWLNLSDAEFPELEELVTEYGDFFAMKTNRVYDRVDTAKVHRIIKLRGVSL